MQKGLKLKLPYKDLELNKNKSNERWKIWAESNPEIAKNKAKNWRHRNPEYFLHRSASKRAIRDGIEFSITKEDIPEIPEICPVALIPLFPRNDGTRGPCDNSPTLDRLDPLRGYTKENIRVISHKGNRWKNDMTVEDVKRLFIYMSQTAPGLEGQTLDSYVNAFHDALKA